jgi:hypothetical protein
MRESPSKGTEEVIQGLMSAPVENLSGKRTVSGHNSEKTVNTAPKEQYLILVESLRSTNREDDSMFYLPFLLYYIKIDLNNTRASCAVTVKAATERVLQIGRTWYLLTDSVQQNGAVVLVAAQHLLVWTIM